MAKAFEAQLRGYQNAPLSMKKDPTFPIFTAGYERGKNDVRHLVLTHLQEKYIEAPDRPDRGSPEAQYLLGLVRELSELIQGATATNDNEG